MTRKFRFNRMLAAATGACMVLAATGCATPPDANDPDAVAEWEETNDPLEPMNRAIFDFNMALDEVLLKPLAKGYRFIFPQYVRDRIHDVLQNAGEPINFFNAVLQADSDRAATALGRLMLNSTFGLAGLYDLADYEFDIPVTDEMVENEIERVRKLNDYETETAFRDALAEDGEKKEIKKEKKKK